LGDIDFYLEQRNIQNLREVEKRMLLKKHLKRKINKTTRDQKKIKSLNNKLSNVEAKINQLEKAIKEDRSFRLEINYDK
jgi:ATP-binding cassette subfamily F protein 3